eukprot:gene1568-12693_t
MKGEVLFIYMNNEKPSKFYNKYNLLTTIQLMKCKVKDAEKITSLIFKMVSKNINLEFDDSKIDSKISETNSQYFNLSTNPNSYQIKNDLNIELKKQIEKYLIYQNENIISIERELFYDLISIILKSFGYVKNETNESKIEDFKIACDFQEKKIPIIILLGGTSGCGKSTLSSLLGTRLGITQILSTDSIRHMLRGFINENENPIVFSSTYHAYEHLKKSKKIGKELVIEGYKKQCESIFKYIEKFIEKSLKNNNSLIIEGVHLTTDFMVNLLKKYKNILPFVIYISNEEKQKERFSVRSKYMTLDPKFNKYIKYFENIRIIQQYNVDLANDFLIPLIDNTSIDRSIASIQYSIFHSLKLLSTKRNLFDDEKQHCLFKIRKPGPYAWSSKSMLKVILKKRSSLQLEKERKMNQEIEKKEREVQSRRRSSLQMDQSPDSKIKTNLSSSVGKFIEFSEEDTESDEGSLYNDEERYNE